jgi:transaldolase
VSLEVDPRLARNPSATLDEARRLFSAVVRPNVLIKIPATQEALPEITAAISEGINVNVTLIFSVERYAQVMEAWLSRLEAAACDKSKRLPRIASVASFFISRVDTAVDPLLEARGAEYAALRGLAGIANAAPAYGCFLNMHQGARFPALAAHGAQVQRPLWASTSPKSSS